MYDLPQLALGLLQQTRVGRRQIATAQALAQATAPLDRAALIAAVAAQVGAGCYGARPEYTLVADIRVLKRAGLSIRYTRAAPHPGYRVPSDETDLLHAVVTALEELAIPYMIGGSVTLAVWAIPRPAHDLDLVVDLPVGRISEFYPRFPAALHH